MSAPDMVNHPPHYTGHKIEVLDFILDWFKDDYLLGQVIKYACRAGKKDPAKEVEDLEKAEFYLKRKIALLRTRDGADLITEWMRLDDVIGYEAPTSVTLADYAQQILGGSDEPS